MTYPRSCNGWVDDGTQIKNRSKSRSCPNCSSNQYRETISMEKCDACGLECDYWGAGATSVYENMMDRMEREREREREIAEAEEERLIYEHNNRYDDDY